MTAEQAFLIRESFEPIRAMAGPVAMLFYGRLFEVAPETRGLFPQDLCEQSKKLMAMFNALIAGLERFDAMRAELREMGARHAGYGVEARHYEVLTGAMLWTFARVLEERFTDEVRAAWVELIGQINAEMLSGAGAPP